MTEDVDYHVGLLRGYMLALNAPTQILNALSVLLTDYKSKAGPVIGAPPKLAVPAVPVMAAVTEAVITHAPRPKIFEDEKSGGGHWGDDEHKTMKTMYENGSSIEDIRGMLPGRSAASIYKRLSDHGIKRKKAS